MRTPGSNLLSLTSATDSLTSELRRLPSSFLSLDSANDFRTFLEKWNDRQVAEGQKENEQREAGEERPCARAADAAGEMKNWSNSMSPV